MAEKPDGCSSTCNPKKICCFSSGRGACSCRVAGVLCTDYCPCGKERQCSNKPISKKPTTIANSESDKVRAMTRRVGTMAISKTTTESTYFNIMAEKPDGCSSTCNPAKICCFSSGRGACSCRAAGVLCTDYCPCGKERQCSNKSISKKPTTIANSESDKVRAMTRRVGTAISETTTESTYLAKTSTYTIASATTGGGCSFDDLVHGEKNYVCEASYLLNLKEEPKYTSDETEEREKANQQVARLIRHLNGIFSELKIRGKTVQKFYIGKTYAPKSQRKGVVFNNMDPFTFTKNGISSRWSSYYKGMGYDGLIVLTVVTKNLLLPKERRQKYKDQEDYALMLERRLIEYYRYNNDPRIENPTLKEGGKSSVLYAGYPVYVAVKFKPKSTCVKLKK